jgi:hypothetical protein
MAWSSEERPAMIIGLMVMVAVAGVNVIVNDADACDRMLTPTFCAEFAVNTKLVPTGSCNMSSKAVPTFAPSANVGLVKVIS